MNNIKRMALMLLLGLFVISAQAQLLYRISGKDLKQPSYIIGTYHFANVHFVDSIPGLKDAMATTQQVYGELDMQDMLSQENIVKYMAAMMLPEGKSLKDVLSAEQLAKLNAFLTTNLGADLTNPMVEQQMGRFTPMALETQLEVASIFKAHPGDFDPQNGLDEYFQKEARQAGKTVGGLETIDFQIKMLFTSQPLERQVEGLMCFIDHNDQQTAQVEDVIKAYYAQDLKKVGEAMDEKFNNECDATEEEKATMIYNRNADWLTKLPAIMKAKPTLVVVGAGHLPGDKGVLEGLRKLGYTVEGVK